MNGIGGAKGKIKPAHQPGRVQNIAALDADKLGMPGAPPWGVPYKPQIGAVCIVVPLFLCCAGRTR